MIDPSTLPNRPDRTHWAIFGARIEEVAVLPRDIMRFNSRDIFPYVLTVRHHGRYSWRLRRDLFASFEDAMSAWQDCNRALPCRHRKAEPTVVHLSNHEAFLFAGVYRKTSIDDGVKV